MRAEILDLGKIMEETPNRKFTDNYLWGVLPMVTTELKPLADKESAAEDKCHLKSIARNIQSSHNIEGSTTSNINDLDADVLSSLQSDGAIYDESNKTPEIVDVIIGKKYTVKVNKVCHSKPGCIDIYASGIAKITI